MPRIEKRNIDLSSIKRTLNLIIHQWKPEEIWLFGSRARSDHYQTSDWDLFVVLPQESEIDDRKNRAHTWKIRRKTSVYIDLIFCGKEDFYEYSVVPNTLSYEVFHEGFPIYDKTRKTKHR